MRLAGKIGLVALATFAAIQAIRVDQSNPPVTADLQAPPAVKEVLRRACYDCHSNETRWPWYGHVAPTSWLLHHDVFEGREALDFSEWGTLSPAVQAQRERDVVESIAEGEMPLWYYLPLHPSARLSAADKSVLDAWAAPASPDP